MMSQLILDYRIPRRLAWQTIALNKEEPRLNSEAFNQAIERTGVNGTVDNLSLARVASSYLDDRINYSSLARRVLQVVHLNPGELATFDTPRNTRINLETVMQAVSVRVNYSELMTHRFQILTTAINRLEAQMVRRETSELFMMLSRASISFRPLALVDAVSELTVRRLVPNSLLINPQQFASLISTSAMAAFQTSAISETGIVGSLYGMNVIVNPEMVDSLGYLVSTPANLGVLAVRTPATVYVSDDPFNLNLSLTVNNETAMAILDNNAVIPVRIG